jgi:hypothetical protein
MRDSVRVMLNGIIDYAGLFPPARLDMSEAFDRFIAHRSGPHGWMLSRFVCPAPRLSELWPLLGRLHDEDPPVRISVLGRGGTTTEGFVSGVAADLEDVDRFRSVQSDRAIVDQYEVRLPDDTSALAEIVASTLTSLDATSMTIVPFFEASLLAGWRDTLPQAIAQVAEARDGSGAAGIKIRCGGLDATAVPSPVAVAAAISACRRHGLPLKATQGLHHPVRHFDHGLETTVHGFLNLFVAGVLAFHDLLTEDQLLAIVGEEEAAAFRFVDDGLVWRGCEADLDQITAGRTNGATSFGSCSFSEPRGDLVAMTLLDPDLSPTDE